VITHTLTHTVMPSSSVPNYWLLLQSAAAAHMITLTHTQLHTLTETHSSVQCPTAQIASGSQRHERFHAATGRSV